MRDAEGRTPRRVCVTRTGADVYLVVVGSTTFALSWLELTALAAESSEAAGLREPLRLPKPGPNPDPDGGGCRGGQSE